MRFDVFEWISLHGTAEKPNEDRAGVAGPLAWVIDGATDLGPPGLLGSQGGAAWLASAASSAFTTASGTGIQETCAQVFGDLETRFARERTRAVEAPWELPKAAFAAAQLVGNTLEVAWAADCAILRAGPSGTAWCTGAPDTSAEAADAAALGVGIGATGLEDAAVLADRRAHRGSADHEALSPVAAASARVTRSGALPVTAGDDILLMSDGFLSLVSDYRLYTADSLIAAMRARGLAALATELRAVEAEDAACLRFPRFKVSDDATALWLRVAA